MIAWLTRAPSMQSWSACCSGRHSNWPGNGSDWPDPASVVAAAIVQPAALRAVRCDAHVMAGLFVPSSFVSEPVAEAPRLGVGFDDVRVYAPNAYLVLRPSVEGLPRDRPVTRTVGGVPRLPKFLGRGDEVSGAGVTLPVRLCKFVSPARGGRHTAGVVTSPGGPCGPTEAPVLGLLGGFELHQRGVAVSVPGSAQRLLAFLALQPRPVLRVYVAGSLWLDSDEGHANSSLRSALWRLHRLSGTLVTATHNRLAIASELDVDVHAVSGVAHTLLDRRSTPRRSAVEQLCLAGDLLPDWYDEWLVIERERFRQLRLHALEAVCRQLTDAARFFEATEVGLAAVAAAPLRESAHRALIEVHLAEGNVAEAVRQYKAYRRLVLIHLGAEPSGGLQELVARVATRA